MTKANDDVLGHYADLFKDWGKSLGPKPTRADFDTYHKLGARPGLQALAGAMAMRPQGVTGGEIVQACGAPQLNKMRDFIEDGLVKREAMPRRNGKTVYKLTLTSKGAAKIKSTAKPAKVAKVTKPKATKKAKVAPAVTSEPVTVETPAGDQPQVS